jgi:hypothetical protein
MARTRWPSGPVNPDLLPRPGRSDRQRRWVPENLGPADRSSRRTARAASAESEVRPGPRFPTLRAHHIKIREAGPDALSTVSLPSMNCWEQCRQAGRRAPDLTVMRCGVQWDTGRLEGRPRCPGLRDRARRHRYDLAGKRAHRPVHRLHRRSQPLRPRAHLRRGVRHLQRRYRRQEPHRSLLHDQLPAPRRRRQRHRLHPAADDDPGHGPGHLRLVGRGRCRPA